MTQFQNEVSLYFWMAFWSCTPRLLKLTPPNHFVWSFRLTAYLAWNIFMQRYSIILCSILPLKTFSGTKFTNVAIFFTLCYLSNNFIVFYYNYLLVKIHWTKELYIFSDYGQLNPFLILLKINRRFNQGFWLIWSVELSVPARSGETLFSS